uniref:Uncharacterized protein n=1 Tax=Chrysotila carterae TaxID=13221 RepID=A0A7S4C5B2_CHRCT|mmetsp:Transcript_1987/g.4106  ORF Transcript_1987/g.4106 Transcript_1987/m.4106 type:complete len:279 (+) Transcript_1987:255-1091(+)
MSKRKTPTADTRLFIGKQRLDDSHTDFDVAVEGSDQLDLSELLPEGLMGEQQINDESNASESGDQQDVDLFAQNDDLLNQCFPAHELPPNPVSIEPPAAEARLPLNMDTLQTATELDLSTLTLNAAQAHRIAPFLPANQALTLIKFEGHELQVSELRDEEELEWDSEEITDVEAIIIAEYLKGSSSMKRLDLARNNIADDGAVALAVALSSNGVLEYLNLESNTVAERGGAALIQAVQANSTLQYLNLAYNAIPSACQQELRDVWTREREGLQLGLHL